MFSLCFYLLSLHVILHLPPFLVTCSSFSSKHNNKSSSMLCHPDESSALLAFKNSMGTLPYSTALYYSQVFGFIDYKTRSWKKGIDCCEWQGITCHPTSHHVVELDLQNAGLVGTLDSNNSLFLLHHLRSLHLSWNDFSYSPISPQFGMFPHLESLGLGDSNFSGEVPPEISQLSKLQSLDLSFNLDLKMSNFKPVIGNLTELKDLSFSHVNINSTVPTSFTNLTSLELIELEECNLQGELPAYVLNLPNLFALDLRDNDGLQAYFPLSNWSNNLGFLILSSVNFSSKLPSSLDQSQFNRLETLGLRGCNFHGEIPAWLWNITISNETRLSELDLSDNYFSGSINLNDIYSKLPNLHTTSALLNLNLSHNYLMGSLTSLPWSTLYYVDLSFNMLEGSLPVPPITIIWFLASNNKFTGPHLSSLCKLTSLVALDLSNNRLNDELPRCLGNVSNDLKVLNFGSNSIHGTLPTTFSNCRSLEYLDLSANWLHGLLPRSLALCKNIQVLNLRSNKLRDEFPYWLGTLTHIQVLDLSSNGFYGSLALSKANNPFSMLQVLDLSNNNFSGKIPVAYIKSFRAMMNITQSVGSPKYMELTNYSEYFFSITLMLKGVETKYKKIITSLTIFDLSNNKFEGEIPNSIAQLVSIHDLNLSHNQLLGSIPPSLGNLTLLDSLDLSSNKLTGQIPQELASLTFLEVFNVSENQLVGPIPHGNNFGTFSMDSYEENLGLCGFPLLECGEDGRPRQHPSKGETEDGDAENVSILSEWKIVMMGYGCGIVVGFAWGYYMLSVEKPFWLVKLVHLIELAIIHLLEKFGRR